MSYCKICDTDWASHSSCPMCGIDLVDATVPVQKTLSRRDHFAMAAMTGMLARDKVIMVLNDSGIPKAAVGFADALIAALDGAK